MRIVVTGATGFIGSALVAHLSARGDEVVVVTRDAARAPAGAEVVVGEVEHEGAWQQAIDGADGVVHLAGEPIAGKRWDAMHKQRVRDSRVEGTHCLVEAIGRARVRPKVLVSASGVDYYAFALDKAGFDDDEVTEDDPPAETFLGRVCRAWEDEARAAEAHGVRVARMRTGLVVGPGGAVARMATPFRLFAGGRIGNGRQFVSWIHRDDVVAAYAAALSDDRYAGPINLVAGSVRNADFAAALGRALHRPSWLPVPGFALRAAVGELAEYLVNGRNVVPRRLEQLGFAWTRRDLADALAHSS
jgi:hypothetical protein